MAYRFSAWQLGLLLVVVAATLVGGATAESVSISAAPDLTGTWKVVNTSGPGAAGTIVITNGTGGRFNGTGYGSFVVKGSVTGSRVHYTVSNSTYTSTVDGTLNSSATRITYTWVDSNNQKGSAYLERQGAPPLPTPAQASVCLPAACSQGLDLGYDPALGPGQVSDTMTVGCGTSRTTSSASVAAAGSCSLTADLLAAIGDLTSTSGPVSSLGIDMGGAIQLTGTPDPAWQAIFAEQAQLTKAGSIADPDFLKLINDLLKVTAPADAGALQQADDVLAPDFPSGDRQPASARSSAFASSPAFSPSLVIQSISAEHPTAAAGKAFTAAMKLATAPTYSPARGQARLTLGFALELGRLALNRHLKSSGKQIALAQAHTTVSFHTKKKLALAATPLGARILRVLEVAGLRHKVHVQLTINSTQNGKTKHATRSIKVG